MLRKKSWRIFIDTQKRAAANLSDICKSKIEIMQRLKQKIKYADEKLLEKVDN